MKKTIIKLIKSPIFILLVISVSFLSIIQERQRIDFSVTQALTERLKEIAGQFTWQLGIPSREYINGKFVYRLTLFQRKKELLKIAKKYNDDPIINQIIKLNNTEYNPSSLWWRFGGFVLFSFIFSIIAVTTLSTISYLNKSWTFEGAMKKASIFLLIFVLIGFIGMKK